MASTYRATGNRMTRGAKGDKVGGEAGGGRDLSTARSALTRRRKLERYCISEAMIAPRRLTLNCIRPLQEFSRHYGIPRLPPIAVCTPSCHFPHASSTHGDNTGVSGSAVPGNRQSRILTCSSSPYLLTNVAIFAASRDK